MATSEGLQFVQFTFPPSQPQFCKSSPPWSSKPSGLISSLNASDIQRIQKQPTATFSSSKYQIEEERNTAARVEADTHPLPLEKQSRANLRPKISTKASNAGSTLQRLEQPAVHWAGLQVNRTQSGLGEPQDGSRNQSVILDNSHNPVEGSAGNEASNASSDCDTGHIERVASLHDTSTPSELASEPHGVPSIPAQAQPNTLPQSFKPLEDQINQQDVNITQRTSVDSALPSIAKASDSGDDGWNDANTAELEKELELALAEQQAESLSAGTSTIPSPHSLEALQDEIQSRERETIDSILDKLRDVTRRGGPAHDLECREPQETQVVEGGAVAMQQQEELAQPPVGDVQDLVEVENANDHEDKEATEALPAAQPKIDEQRYRLRGVRTRQLAGHHTKTTQYRVVWGEHSHRSDSWFNEDEVRMSMACEPYSHDSALQINICRVRKMHSSLHKGRNVFEYIVDALGVNNPWIAEDQLRISLSPVLVAKLKASSLYPLSQAQREVLVKHSTTPISDEWHNTSQASRSSSAQTDSALGRGVEPTTRKRGRRDICTEISSDTYYSANTDNSHNAYDTDNEDPRPTKRRKPRSAPIVTSPIHLRQSPQPLTTGVGIDETHSQDDDGCLSTSIEEQQHYVSQISRGSSAAAEAVPAAAYQEWPLHGFLKRTMIGNVTSFNLEFHLVNVEEVLDLSSPFQALGRNLGIGLSAPSKSVPHTLIASSKQYNITSGLSKKRAQSQEALVSDWAISTRRGNELNKSQESLLAKMIQENKTWSEIRQHFPDHPLQLLKDNFFKNQGGKPRKRGRKPGVKVGGA